MGLRVLEITLSAAIGGGPEHVDQLLRNLPSDVETLVAAPRDYPYWERYAARVGASKMLQLPHRRFRPGALLALARFARARHVDILHSHGKGAGLYGRLASLLTGIPCVHTFHGIHIGGMGRIGRAAYLRLETFLGRRTARCIAVSRGERDQALSLGFAPSSSLRLIENGVALSSSPREAVFPEARPCSVVQATRFDYAKNSGLLVDVARALRDFGRLDDFVFTLLGDGNGREEVRQAAEAAGVAHRFVFKGMVEDVRPFLREAFCYLSTSRWEGLPLSVLESLAEGLPVVASDVVGNRDCVRPGKVGFLYPLDSPRQAAEALLTLRDAPTLWVAFSRNASQECARLYDVALMAEKIRSVYEEVRAERCPC
ncbi:glycosyltransferase [Desulfovibrio sp. X2]|uniref:glycosyltransferase n=1 Tax=Desulfovibrio sp. X2 TaxID=941449 RepID=UPI00155A5D43|nr:glycosyltransferase [Desulfovibrio sp. X2]